jgi:hypothetical protein
MSKQRAIRKALRLGDELSKALATGFCCECRTSEQLHKEFVGGCWDGVRALIESHDDALKSALRAVERMENHNDR